MVVEGLLGGTVQEEEDKMEAVPWAELEKMYKVSSYSNFFKYV